MTFYEYRKTGKPFTPGTRLYACIYRISRNGQKLVSYLQPCVVELCLYNQQALEERYRNQYPTKAPSYVVPVNPDGTLNWNKAHDLYECHLSDDPSEIRQLMTAQITDAGQLIAKRRAILDAMDNKRLEHLQMLNSGKLPSLDA